MRALHRTANQYPPDLTADQVHDIPRIAFNITLSIGAIGRPPAEIEICDIGGGIGLFSVGCAAYGVKRSVLVDDFDDPVNRRLGDAAFGVHRQLGVDVVARDAVLIGISDIDGEFDVITTFDSMEHWHNSPKRLFSDVMDKLKPGGVFVLGAPNCKNLRKRITTLLGRGELSSMHDWYEEPIFRGHVREPDVGDLQYIARDMGLTDVNIYGRNWLGYRHANPITRAITKIIDRPLRFFPTLCADLYMVGRKPTIPTP